VARAAGRWVAGQRAGVAWLGVLWPFGFIYGPSLRVRVIVFSGRGTDACLPAVSRRPEFGRWALFLLAAVALLWTNYFGWAILGCLAIDQILRSRSSARNPADSCADCRVVVRGLLPLFRAFRNEFGTDFDFLTVPLAILANAGVWRLPLFVSESIAPCTGSWHSRGHGCAACVVWC